MPGASQSKKRVINTLCEVRSMILEARNITKEYRVKGRKTLFAALKNVSFALQELYSLIILIMPCVALAMTCMISMVNLLRIGRIL